ncbi:MAG TPA: HipA domain-containing protein [Xanthobacteraceae bacterium]|nr:HipA domain-containing protein [Xanthobacteraceae bacterium]
MTSKNQATECFVYITLPGQTETVTAGRFVPSKSRDGTPLGKFVYGKSYLARNNAVDIDPVELKLTDETYETARLGGVFGALRDAGPDYWGRRVIEKHSGKTTLGEIDYLLESPDDRAGALSFGLSQEPPAPRRRFNKTLDLAKLQKIADDIVRGEIDEKDADAVQAQELMLIGTSMGGTRPKTVVEDEQGLWIAKFNRADDRWNFAKVEHAMLVLAKKCGISAAESRVVQVSGKDVLLVHRFDRFQAEKGYTRARMISGLTLLQADENERARWSYISMIEEMRRVGAKPSKDASELFRRMCFNALISNLDDHPRNHALIAKEREWNLSPAYDLTPSPVIAQDQRDLAMICGDRGRLACASNILSQHTRFLLGPVEAKKLIDDMRQLVSATWYDVVRAGGVSKKDAEAIRTAFVYEGFDR